MLDIVENDDTSLSQRIDDIPLSQLIGALLQIVVVTLVVCLLFALFPGKR